MDVINHKIDAFFASSIARASAFSAKIPLTADVVVMALVFLTPRLHIQVCLSSTTTIVPIGSRISSNASA